MSDDIEIVREGIRRFRTGGIAIGCLPLVLGLALLLSDHLDTALSMIAVSIFVLFLILWTTHCAEDIVAKLQSSRRKP